MSVLLNSSHCGGGWTLYSLTLPSPAALYNDILAVGCTHRWSSPTTYCHLLCEGHIILRTALTTVTWKPGASEVLPGSCSEEFMNKLEDLYRESCALLADYYIMWVLLLWMDWTELAQALVIKVITLWVPWIAYSFQASWVISSYSARTVLHQVNEFLFIWQF
jgi:hypothetical protein